MNTMDLEPIIFRTKNTSPKKKTYIRSTTKKIEENAEDGDFKIERATKNLQEKIKSGRVNKNLTQKELANKCNLSHSIIQDYESGKGIPSTQNLRKISRVLGIPLSNKN